MAKVQRRKVKSSASQSPSGSRGRSSARKLPSGRGDGFAPDVEADPSDEVEQIYIIGLRNAHAVEKEALQVMRRQVDRVTNYPEVSKRLREHINETEEQVRRLGQILDQHQATPSMLKDFVTQVMGNAASIPHSTAGYEVLKNAFANQAFEAYEIAAYKALITMAMRQGDRKAIPLLKLSLAEEERMAKWCDETIGRLTVAYLDREAPGKTAHH